ncbi:hypothetical protein HDU96_001452 [Phlyctochytrium bullatum]|nr:hypothetical protein HDU96_001452 [Phlyctochytrium bullatum]
MSLAAKEKFRAFTSNRRAAGKETTASAVLFPQLAKELAADVKLAQNLRGLFIITVLKKGKHVDEWYLLFQGRDHPAIVSRTRPHLPSPPTAKSNTPAAEKTQMPVVVVEMEDADLLNFATGGLSAVKAFVSGRIKVVGDMQTAFLLEEVFLRAGGVERTLNYIREQGLQAAAASASKL